MPIIEGAAVGGPRLLLGGRVLLPFTLSRVTPPIRLIACHNLLFLIVSVKC